MKKILVVLSGGQDSTTCLFWAVQQYGKDAVSTISFHYGQRHFRELQAAQLVAGLAGIPRDRQLLVKLPANTLQGRSPLTNPNEQLETYSDFASMDATIGDRVELTFVPMRNALFLTLAANRAACMDGPVDIVTGVCEADNANYPDCRAQFIHQQEETIRGALGNSNIAISTPLMTLTKAETVLMAWQMTKVHDSLAWQALAYSHTAYSGEFPPVTQDHSTVLRAHGFQQAGLPDPLIVRAKLIGLMEYPDTPNYKVAAVEYTEQKLLGLGLFRSEADAAGATL